MIVFANRFFILILIERPDIMADIKIIETNKHLNTPEKRVNRISKSVYASQRIEGVRISRRDARKYTEEVFTREEAKSGFVYRKDSRSSSGFANGKDPRSPRG